MIEGPIKKALRHLLHGEFDIQTIKRGLEYYRNYLKNWSVSRRAAKEYGGTETASNPWDRSNTIKNYDGFEGFNIHEFYVKPTDGSDPTIKPNFYLIDIPPRLNLQLQVRVSSYHNRKFDSPLHETLSKSEIHRIGIVGPLCAKKSSSDMWKLPNNGFYYRNDPEKSFPFGETTPPKQRRGAIVFWDDKPPELVSDERKWNLVNTNPKLSNLIAVVGTSNFITNDETLNREQPLTNYNVGRKTVITYLVSYTENGIQKWSHLVINNLFVDRVTVQNILMALFRDKPFFAVEMEMSGGGLVYKNSNGELESWSHFVRCTDRRDMYLFG